MYNNKKFLAIIPARSGSKGLKDKNIKELNRKPMIAYSIEAALKSKVFDYIIVSTDSKKYAEISQEYGANVPFLRPDNLSNDEASSIDVIEHTILELEKRGQIFDYFMLLQPTSPLRTKEDILESIKLVFEKKANSIVSVCETEHSPLWCNILDEKLNLDNFLNKDLVGRRQALPTYYRLNGAIYLSKIDYFIKCRDFYKEKSYAYIMDKKNSIDIDDIIDFKIAKALLNDKDK
ncbi:MAG: acylneuraminate cytidylyltransferase family protein [Marinisporobacter sp.]|jgi:CMP-N,N'-diacetyllegionaminic acid synthase|nr:acylneuraminate cytidylyltransferase family protein [Marinisporobacter sp.]